LQDRRGGLVEQRPRVVAAAALLHEALGRDL
jgi:hypothetical protein